jgi:hypothetical protein
MLEVQQEPTHPWGRREARWTIEHPWLYALAFGLAIGGWIVTLNLILFPDVSGSPWLSGAISGVAWGVMTAWRCRCGSLKTRAQRRLAATSEDEWRVASRVEVDPRSWVIPLVIAAVVFWAWIAYILVD